MLKNKGLYPGETTGNITVKYTHFAAPAKGIECLEGHLSASNRRCSNSLSKKQRYLVQSLTQVNVKYRVQRSLVFVHNSPNTSLPAGSGKKYISVFILIDLVTK